MNRIFASILGFSGRNNSPQLTLVESFLIASDPNAIVRTIVSHVDVFVFLDVLDSVHLTFLLEHESLVGSTMETVHDYLTVICHVLSHVESFDAVAVGSIDDIVLIGLEGDSLNESHALAVADLSFGDDVMDIHEFLTPFETFLFVGVLQLFSFQRFNQPDLISTFMNIVLKYSFSFFSLAASNIETSSICVGFNDVTFIGKISFFNSGNFEPTACMFTGISDNIESVVLLVFEDAKAMIIVLSNKGELISFGVDVEMLIFVVMVLVNFKFVVFVDGQDHVGVQNGEYFVEDFGIGFKLRFNIGMSWFLSNFSCFFVAFFVGTFWLNRNKMPKLVVSLMDVVLKNIFAVLSLSSSNVQSSVSCMSFDEVSFLGPFTFFTQRSLKPTAGVLVLVNNDLSSVISLVLENAESTILTLNHKSKFIVLFSNLENLSRFILESINLKFSLLIDSQTLVFIKN